MPLTEKAKKWFKPRSFLLTLVITIVGFICIPLLAMQTFVIGQSTDEFQKSNQEYYQSVLQTSATTFTSREDMLIHNSVRISLNEIIQKPARNHISAYSLYEIGQSLLDFGAGIPYVETVGVYYSAQGFLMANENKYTPEQYVAKLEPNNTEKAQELLSFLNNTQSTNYYATSDGSTLIFSRRIALSTAGKPDSLVFFAMDATSLEESFRASVSLQAHFAIVDNTGAFLLRGNDFIEKIPENDLTSFLSSGSSSHTFDNDDLVIHKYTDPKSNITFLISVDKDASEGRLIHFATQIHISTIVMVVLMLISLCVTIYINYRPIHRLLKKHSSIASKEEVYSEIELLDSAFFKLDEQMANQQTLLQDFILGDLLYGNTVKPELINQYFPEERYRFFAVATTLCPSLPTAQSHRLAEKISESTGYSIFVTSISSRPHTIIICLAEHQIDSVSLRTSTVKAIEAAFGAEYPLSMGDMVTDIFSLRASYRSAVTADLSSAPGELDDATDGFASKLNSFSQCIYIGDEAEAINHLDSIKQLLYQYKAGDGYLRYCCFKLVQAYLTGVNGSQSTLGGRDMELLLSYTSMDHLFQLLRESIHQVCHQVVDNERSLDLQLQQQLLQYVDEHFKDSDLCLTAAADHIGASIYTVSRLFKEITGRGFKDYVTEKRLEYGQVLLCTTQKTIAEISAAAGFENANYFATVFKQKYGMPPTKYRNIQKEQQSD